MMIKASKKDLSMIINEIKKSSPRILYIKKMLKRYKAEGINFSSKYYHGKTLLHYAIEYRLNCLIKPLIKSGCNPNICDDRYLSPLHLAVIKKNAKAIKILVKNGADINITGEFEQTPLHLATTYGNLKFMKLLINNKADIMQVDEKNLSVLDYANDEKNLKIIEYLNKKSNMQKGEEEC